MGKIITLDNLEKELNIIHKTNQSIILLGGCFDILHIGHIKFLQEAKRLGDSLLVLLENDEKVKKLKGVNRPYFPQKDRAEVLAALSFIDYVILLPLFENDESYDQLIRKIHPDIIAVTSNDPILTKKKKQAEMIGGKIAVIPHIKTFSSSQLAKLLGID